MGCGVFCNYLALFSGILVMITLVTVFQILYMSLRFDEKAYYKNRNIVATEISNIAWKMKNPSQIEYKPNVS